MSSQLNFLLNISFQLSVKVWEEAVLVNSGTILVILYPCSSLARAPANQEILTRALRAAMAKAESSNDSTVARLCSGFVSQSWFQYNIHSKYHME